MASKSRDNEEVASKRVLLRFSSVSWLHSLFFEYIIFEKSCSMHVLEKMAAIRCTWAKITGYSKRSTCLRKNPSGEDASWN